MYIRAYLTKELLLLHAFPRTHGSLFLHSVLHIQYVTIYADVHTLFTYIKPRSVVVKGLTPLLLIGFISKYICIQENLCKILPQ